MFAAPASSARDMQPPAVDLAAHVGWIYCFSTISLPSLGIWLWMLYFFFLPPF